MSDNDSLRPFVHFTPPSNWMNDPNGLIYHQGVYHLYYQHNPYGPAWGHMSWGHAVSPDLLHWEHLPIALWEAPEAGYTIFSGSMVYDKANTSHLGSGEAPPLVAVFTADYRSDPLEDVHIAYSLDGGRSLSEYAENPVIHVGGATHREAKFGDPKVFWHAPTAQWIMVNIQGRVQGHVAIYGSPNLRDWRHLSDFVAPVEAPGVWECPDLFPLAVDGDQQRTKWVLKVNTCVPGNGTRYFVGAFDGATFSAECPAICPRPDNDAFYAEVTYNDIPDHDGRRIMFGWLRQKASEARLWTGAQSLPRVLGLRSTANGYILVQWPFAALDTLRIQPEAMPVLAGERTQLVDGFAHAGQAVDVVLTAQAGDLSLELVTVGGRRVVMAYDVAAGKLHGTGAIEAPLYVALASGERTTWRLVVDRSLVELYAADGRATLSFCVAPDEDSIDRIELVAKPGVVQKAQVWRLAPAIG